MVGDGLTRGGLEFHDHSHLQTSVRHPIITPQRCLPMQESDYVPPGNVASTRWVAPMQARPLHRRVGGIRCGIPGTHVLGDSDNRNIAVPG